MRCKSCLKEWRMGRFVLLIACCSSYILHYHLEPFTGLCDGMAQLQDEVQEQLKRLEKGKVVPDLIKELKRRKLVTKEKVIWYSLKKGPEFVVKRKTLATDVTREHLKSGDWKDLEFKDYNYEAQGQPIAIGYSQPLLEVREAIQNIFLEMGFSEMPTNMFVESR
uniref:Phenylalanyl-tRNA synthetase domain-containing protein n=1 Tax=Aegilops tauschii subsp. strangulata TaxID=200361 RepID=A0A453PNC7_AEGTS